MGLPPGSAQGSANHQFPFRRATVSSWPVPHPGVAFLRVYRDQIAKNQMEIHEGRQGLVLLRRAMASDARRWRSIHIADDGTWARFSAHSRSTDGGSKPL